MKNEKNFTEFYLSFMKLCRREGKSPSVVAREAGISSGAPTAWKNGAVPKQAQRNKLCEYFGVTDNELLGYVETKEKTTKPSEQEIRAAFFEGAEDLPQEDLDALWDDARDYILYKIQQRRHKND